MFSLFVRDKFAESPDYYIAEPYWECATGISPKDFELDLSKLKIDDSRYYNKEHVYKEFTATGILVSSSFLIKNEYNELLQIVSIDYMIDMYEIIGEI